MKDGPIDVLSVDLGTNGLCYPEVTAAKLLGYVTDFIQLWLHEGIRPNIWYFCQSYSVPKFPVQIRCLFRILAIK